MKRRIKTSVQIVAAGPIGLMLAMSFVWHRALRFNMAIIAGN